MDINKKKHIKFDETDESIVQVNTEVARPQFEPKQKGKKDTDSRGKWYHEYASYTKEDNDPKPLKDEEQSKLNKICENAYNSKLADWRKRDPSDQRWLQTALHKGTIMDRANAGALLLISNPLGNFKVISILTAFAKPSNKAYSEIIVVLSNVWKQALLPSNRKLKPLVQRGSDWLIVQRCKELTKDQQQAIYAQWYYEDLLKGAYTEFVKGLQLTLQQGQEHTKRAAISCCTDLLINTPEKESMLLSTLINKLGDPLPKVAAKALSSLYAVLHQHPNMGMVIVLETEKLLFRNNISERAVHFGLCLLAALLSHTVNGAVCSKLVHICFALFNLLVQRGAVNNRTMLAILRCLQRAVAHATPADVGKDILSKDLQDTIYRLAHNAELHISVQTFGLLLQLITSPLLDTKQKDRFYNALYQKLSDLQLVYAGVRTTAHLLHIVHRAMYMDSQRARVQAYVKRLIQLALHVLPHIAAACLIVIHKLQRVRPDLFTDLLEIDAKSTDVIVENADKQDISTIENRNKEAHNNLYNAYGRVPAYSGAENTACHELILLAQHYHPTVQVITECIENKKKSSYFGDPLQDFSLAHFLDRFVFKNPKKPTKNNFYKAHHAYTPIGARGKSVKELTAISCTEDEAFIFNFLEEDRHKREQGQVEKESDRKREKEVEEDDELNLKSDEVDDDEFDVYLDNFFGTKANTTSDKESPDSSDEENDENFEFLKALGGTMSKRQKSQHQGEEEEADAERLNEIDTEFSEDDLDSLEDDDDNGESDDKEDQMENNEDNSDDDDYLEDDSDEDAIEDVRTSIKTKRKRVSNNLNGTSFAKKLKSHTDMTSLFAAADDFSMMLEETAEIKGQGTSNAVNSKGVKVSEKQLQWEKKSSFTNRRYKKR